MKRVDDVFYEDIIKEAARGAIDCDFLIPICFSTKELKNNETVDIEVAENFDGAMVPTLLIKDRNKLSESIKRYVFLAKTFYKDDPRLNDTSNKEKYIISSLLANTLVTDFNDIANLFDRHSDFLMDSSLEQFIEPQNIGYSSILGADVIVSMDNQSIVEETPKAFNIWLEDNEKNIVYKFPTVRFGVSQDKAYIYAVQANEFNNNKKIERILRKTGEGFDEQNESRDPIDHPENLYSVSPWALIALSIAIPLIKNYSEPKEFLAPYFLVNRWNATEISYKLLKERYKDNDEDPYIKKLIDKKQSQVLNHDATQRNITDKFIRNFRRLEHHFSNINIDSFQLDMDSCLHFMVADQYECNNSLLNEMYTMADSYKNKSKGKVH